MTEKSRDRFVTSKSYIVKHFPFNAVDKPSTRDILLHNNNNSHIVKASLKPAVKKKQHLCSFPQQHLCSSSLFLPILMILVLPQIRYFSLNVVLKTALYLFLTFSNQRPSALPLVAIIALDLDVAQK